MLRVASCGFTDEQAPAKSTPSALGVRGTIKQVAFVERYWMDQTLERTMEEGTEDIYRDRFHPALTETLDDLLDS